MNSKTLYILYSLIFIVVIGACSGSKKYFKAAEKLEKQGLVDDAANYYLEALQRKNNNANARIKLLQVGQKHVSNLASTFFREYNTQQYEQSLLTFDKLKDFTEKSNNLNVTLNYPQAYHDDYNKALDFYLNKYYDEAYNYVNQYKYDLALQSISKIKKYNTNFKTTYELEVTATCEPLYQAAIKNIESKNYTAAENNVTSINIVSTTYKDTKELTDLIDNLLKRSFLIFEPKTSSEKNIEDKLLNDFIELSNQKTSNIKLINNTPFTSMPDAGDGSNIDLIQSIQKASGADYFYIFDVANKQEVSTNPTRSSLVSYEKIVVKKDTSLITDFKSISYYQTKAQRAYAYDFKYKIIDAKTNQIITTKTENCVGQDNLDYYDFGKYIPSNINNVFPYNPLTTPVFNQYNPTAWRNGFNHNKTLKSFDDLKTLADKHAVEVFNSSINNYLTK